MSLERFKRTGPVGEGSGRFVVSEGNTCGTPQDNVVAWHTIRFPDSNKWLAMAKLTEEVGELARAMIGEHEGRPNRGNVMEEAMDVLITLYVLIGRFYPQYGDLAFEMSTYFHSRLAKDDVYQEWIKED